ncbi:MAG TPA: choice-of-anchor tandem repeat GloVer-containing protein [Terriglobales bacterium]|nr:choice-of-anchor tandem repeat GloVer-containing protein [Terriglobales bacterium]
MKRLLLFLIVVCLQAFAQLGRPPLHHYPNSGASFAPAVAYDSGAEAVGVAIADINGDGKADLLVANCGASCNADGNVGVLLGNGDGTFQPVVNYSSGGIGTRTVVPADVNGDGKIDLVVSNECADTACEYGSVGILLGNGDGTFQTVVTYSSGGYAAFFVAVADLNHDGKPDLVVANNCTNRGNCDGTIGVLLGNGDGTFQPAITYSSAGYNAESLMIADVNNDGKPDVVVGNTCADSTCENGSVGILLGNGNGTFEMAVAYGSGGHGTLSVAVADLNADGNPDIAVADEGTASNGLVGVLLGNGDGTFQTAVNYDSGGQTAYSVAIADVNGDGKPDLVAANYGSSSVGVLLGNGDGTFQAAVSYGSGAQSDVYVAVSDLNGDGKPDIAVANECASSGCTEGALGVLLNTTTLSPNLTTLANFDGANGANPFANLVQGLDGNLYGTAEFGGANCTPEQGCGTVFSITPTGTLTVLYSFCQQVNCDDGASPRAPLVETINGNFYGTTENNGTRDQGVIFRITPTGTFTTLYNFCQQRGCADGANPVAGLVQSNGNLYGTTRYGGASNYGEVFEISPTKLTVLYSFCSQPNCSDGAYPDGTLVKASNGNFYGITRAGGISGCNTGGGCGTVFEITPAGRLRTLYRFCSQTNCSDGSNPEDGLLQATDGSLYGTTEFGGNGFECGAGGCGTIFKMTPGGQLTTLYSFCIEVGCPDGDYPYAGLVEGTDGNLYGATSDGGANCTPLGGCGTIFNLTIAGQLTTLYSFCSQPNCSDGGQPLGGLIQDTNGVFYGTTYFGGAASCAVNGCGTVFSLDMGLGPFVTFVRNAGKVGESGPILGQGFAGTYSVRLNGVPANFTVVSDTLIKATVPQGATTGYVTVTTPTGVLTSNVPFHVIP